MACVLGIDLGTQSIKALVYDSDRKTVSAEGQAPLELVSRADGSREQLAGWWLDGLSKALAMIGSAVLSKVEAVGVSGQQHGFVPVDGRGEVLAPVKLWCDTSTAAECAEITAGFGGELKLIERVGNPILPGYTASKILWLKKTNPEAFARMTSVLLPHDYLNFVLTGSRVMERGDASGTGLLDIRAREWHGELAALIDAKLESRLPPLIESHESCGTVTADAARRFGLPEGIPVSSGGGDNMMGAFGTGAVAPGTVTASLGTSGTLYTAADRPVIDPRGEIAAFCGSNGSWLPLLCTMNCTIATEMARAQFGVSIEGLNEAAAQAPAGCEGVVTLPFYNGERTPNLPNARASVLGMSYRNATRGNILRSAMESAVYGLRQGLDRFRELGIHPNSITLIGGGAKSPLWAQMAADVFELPVRVPSEGEAAAFGAAVQALWCLESAGETPDARSTSGAAAYGVHNSTAGADGGRSSGGTKRENGARARLEEIVRDHVRTRKSVEIAPNPDAFAAYRETYAVYRTYLDTLSPLYG